MSAEFPPPGATPLHDIQLAGPGKHTDLPRLLHEVWRGLTAHRSLPEMERLIFDLENSARRQFSAEEARMACLAYPNLASHQHSHAQFLANVAILGNKIAAGQAVGLDFPNFLNDWLTYHIGVVDRQYLEFAGALSAPSGIAPANAATLPDESRPADAAL